MTDANLNKKHLKATNASKCFKPSLSNIFKKCLILIIMNVSVTHMRAQFYQQTFNAAGGGNQIFGEFVTVSGCGSIVTGGHLVPNAGFVEGQISGNNWDGEMRWGKRYRLFIAGQPADFYLTDLIAVPEGPFFGTYAQGGYIAIGYAENMAAFPAALGFGMVMVLDGAGNVLNARAYRVANQNAPKVEFYKIKPGQFNPYEFIVCGQVLHNNGSLGSMLKFDINLNNNNQQLFQVHTTAVNSQQNTLTTIVDFDENPITGKIFAFGSQADGQSIGNSHINRNGLLIEMYDQLNHNLFFDIIGIYDYTNNQQDDYFTSMGKWGSDYILSGYTNSPSGLVSGQFDMWVVHLDAVGTPINQAHYDFSTDAYAYQVLTRYNTVTNNFEAYLGGENLNGAAGGVDPVVLKIDQGLNPILVANYGTSSDDYGKDIAMINGASRAIDGVLIYGHTDNYLAAGQFQGYLTKAYFNLVTGDLCNQNTINVTTSIDIIQLPSPQISAGDGVEPNFLPTITTSNTNSFSICNDICIAIGSNQRVAPPVVKEEGCCGSEIKESTFFKVFPNPLSKENALQIHITWPNAEEVSLLMYDMNGKLYIEKRIELQSGINQLNQLIGEKGVFEMVIAGKEKRESKKVIVK
jgi:hypothetical protein